MRILSPTKVYKRIAFLALSLVLVFLMLPWHSSPVPQVHSGALVLSDGDVLEAPSIVAANEKEAIKSNNVPKQVESLVNEEQKRQEAASVAELCKGHNWSPKQPVKVYDMFLFNNELMWLDIRLHELAGVVDKFVILEAPITFSGHKKPLHLKENWEQFREFHDKIVHVVLEDDVSQDGDAWARERFQRNAIFSEGFKKLESMALLSKGDVLLLSDVDELPQPKAVHALRHCQHPQVVTLRADFFYYSYEYKQDYIWDHPQATIYNGPEDTLTAEQLRNRIENGMDGAAWHCSYCFSTIKDFQEKLSSFSHQEFNTPQYSDPKRILRLVSQGLDMFREGFAFTYIENNTNVPQYVLHNPKLRFLVDRHNQMGGFSREELAHFNLIDEAV